MKPLLSICIPSYNRPTQLSQLLLSIDGAFGDIEVVVAEDGSPKREEIRAMVSALASRAAFNIRYFENETNVGFDGNIRRLIALATGQFVMFMGDDDLFVPQALDRYIQFLKEHRTKKYILRSYLTRHPNEQIEKFHYFPATTVLPAGAKSVAWLFKRSVTLTGFTISRDMAKAFATTDLDGTLLYQVYLMAEVCLQYESIYCPIPVGHAVQTFRDDKPMFGASPAEKGRYKPGSISQDNSINFTKAYFEVTRYLDAKHGTQLTDLVRKDLSKYSYPFLSIQRKRGIHPFLQYAKRLEVECGFGCSAQYFVYKWGLVVLGETWCDRIICVIKNMLGYTPNF